MFPRISHDLLHFITPSPLRERVTSTCPGGFPLVPTRLLLRCHTLSFQHGNPLISDPILCACVSPHASSHHSESASRALIHPLPFSTYRSRVAKPFARLVQPGF
uniref:Uncharacterized protein n=1 Tax=Steinernema glaseri TaxID=37863 RepID=A0A1I8AHQ9_9BILA